MARDITEGRGDSAGNAKAIAVDVGVVSSTAIWQNTDIAYDIAIGGMPFILATGNERPYNRKTAPFKKDQFDSTDEPGEQSLTGWWLRSQVSFHGGAGINFFDPEPSQSLEHFRFADSKGLDVWTKGEVTLLKNVTEGHIVTGALRTTGIFQSNPRPFQSLRSIKWNGTSGVLMWDEYDVDKIPVDTPGTPVHFINYTSGVNAPVYAICDDGTYAYWITNSATKKEVYKKALTLDYTTPVGLPMFDEIGTITNATMEYIKDRIVLCADNKVYEFATSASAMPTPLYIHPTSTHIYTSIAASGPAIYVAGYNGIQSSIQKFTLSTTGAMPTLTSASVAAELPVGEVVHKIYYYLGYMMIGTNKGIRVANVSDQDGSIAYGPLIVETSQPCYDFAARDHFVWCATSVDGEPGVIRIDLSNEIEPLRFAWANDLYYDGVTGHQTTACAFANGTDRLALCTANASSVDGHVYVEDASTLRTDGYLTTGNIRFRTLEPKNFKRLLGRGDFTYGSLTLETVDADGNEYDHISYDAVVPSIEVTTSNPANAQEYVAYKFIMYRDTDSTKGPVFRGYQAKATIATPRQRLISLYVYNFDEETDKYNTRIGYSGRAYERQIALEAIEGTGDVYTYQDLNTGETRQVQIEGVSLVNTTPPDKNSTGFGGILEVLVRTV